MIEPIFLVYKCTLGTLSTAWSTKEEYHFWLQLHYYRFMCYRESPQLTRHYYRQHYSFFHATDKH
jgi:hypothetical protein